MLLDRCPLFMQAVVTMADLEAWRASAQSTVGKPMTALHQRLQACFLLLQQQLLAGLKARQAAAAATKQVQ